MNQFDMASFEYEYPDNSDTLPMTSMRADDSSVDERDDDQTNTLEYDVLLQEANDSDLRETELTGCVQLGTDENDVPLIVCIPRIGFDKHTVSEAEIKKMYLLFIRMADSLIRAPFSIVYAHDGAQYWLQRQPIVFRFYKLLPRKFKRNLESMYIIHPNVGIKSFFAFSRVFLSKKFFERLNYVENIYDFQKIISPLCLALPYNYLLLEDEELALSSCGMTASLIDTYDPSLKTTRLLNNCVNFLKLNGLQSTGDKFYHDACGLLENFQGNATPPDTPGGQRIIYESNKLKRNDSNTSLKRRDSDSTNSYTAPQEKSPRPTSLFRMGGKLFQDGTSREHSKKNIQENRVQSMSTTAAGTRSGLFATAPTEKRSSMRFGQNTMRFFGQTTITSPFSKKAGTPIGLKSGVKSQSGATAEDLRDHASVSEMSCTSGDSTQVSDDHDSREKIVSLSSVVITDIDTVAQILKMVLRDLPEPVITFATFESMMNICVQFETKVIMEEQWVADILNTISLMPLEHKETLQFLLSFLCEVAAQAEQNSMDMSNLASIFSPTLMRPPTDSESLQNAFQELRRSKSILNLLLVRADMKSEERRALEANNGNDDDVTLKTPGSDNSSMENLSLENLHTNSALLSNSNNIPKNEDSGTSSSLPFPSIPMKSQSLFSTTSTPFPPLPPVVLTPLSKSSLASLENQNHHNNIHNMSNQFVSNRKRVTSRPMSVSLDSSMLSSFLGVEKHRDLCGKLSPIREHETNAIYTPEILKSKSGSFDGSLSSNNDGNMKERDRAMDKHITLKDKGRNSLGSAGMKSLPVKQKVDTRARPMSTSAATSTSLSFFLKMFMSPRESVELSTGNGLNGNLNNSNNINGGGNGPTVINVNNVTIPVMSRTSPVSSLRQPSVPPSSSYRRSPTGSSSIKLTKAAI